MLPAATLSAQLVELLPEIQRLAQVQGAQEEEVGQLRARSAKILEWWVAVACVEMGEFWSDWEARVRDLEMRVRRGERWRKEHDVV